MNASVHEITGKFRLAHPLILLCFIPLVVGAVLFAQVAYAKPNPYTPYFDYTSEHLDNIADCYTDRYSYSSNAYCILDEAEGYTTFAFRPTGELESVGFWSNADMTQVGDFIAWYGTPDRVQTTRYWTGYTWIMENGRLIVQSREDDLYSRVLLVVYNFS
jgi:hypothetical protein